MLAELPSAARLREAPSLVNLIGFVYRATRDDTGGEAASVWDWLTARMQSHFQIKPIELRHVGLFLTEDDGDVSDSEKILLMEYAPASVEEQQSRMSQPEVTFYCGAARDRFRERVVDILELLRAHEQGEVNRNETRTLFDLLASDLRQHWSRLETALPSDDEAGVTLKLITGAVACQRYNVSKPHLLRAVRSGEIRDHRKPGHSPNAALVVDENQVAARWTSR